ncbi:MAG TPA: FAD-dependent oxidoreductase [Anaerolineaceae bacterium]|nr:FAD-dependent oxidoreductase [Anaerolineaceae bacterium]
MSSGTLPKYLVAVIGAGPAGLYAAQELARQNVHVVIFNRDVKPGGLAEYGIYPDKFKMKDGLRSQFGQILSMDQIEYYGNIVIREDGDFRLNELRALGFQAILVTAGAQGTKWLGLPGEDLVGVYHAKDLVYHYNLLPPFSQYTYQLGCRSAVVGAGNVMLDVTHYLTTEMKVDEVIAIARRGPGEVKFTKKELEAVVANLDIPNLETEVSRHAGLMRSLGQNPHELIEIVCSALPRAERTGSKTHFTVQFLLSPLRILGDSKGYVKGLEVEENTLVKEDGVISARGTGVHRVIELDSVVFAIGDKVDGWFGLPVQSTEFVKNPNPKFPVDGLSYEVFDPQAGCPLEGYFVAGWSRKASTGLVGLARKDGTNGAKAVLQYLATLPELENIPYKAITERMERLKKPIITRSDLIRLESIEQDQARRLGLLEFKFATNQEMLEAIGLL